MVDPVSPGVHPLIFMFSGQGSQYYGMGRELFDHDPTFQRWMRRCDEIVEARIGRSVLSVLYDDGRRRFDPFAETVYTHPAIFAIQWLVSGGRHFAVSPPSINN